MLKRSLLRILHRLLCRRRPLSLMLGHLRHCGRWLAPLLLLTAATCLIVSTALTSSAAAAAAPPPPAVPQQQQQPQPQQQQQAPLSQAPAAASNRSAAQPAEVLQQQPSEPQAPSLNRQPLAVTDFLRRVADASHQDPGGRLMSSLRSKLPLLNLLATSSADPRSLSERAKACAGARAKSFVLRYVQNFAYVHNEPDLCAGQLLLLTAVHSNAKNFNRRATIRRTWGSLRYVGANRLQLVFFLGLPGNPEHQAEIDAESRRHRDIVQLDYREHYRNMSLKHLSVYEWMILHCQSAQYLAKVDDDTFTDVVHLAAFLQHSPPDGFYCSNTRGAKPQRLRRGPKAKWAVNRAEFAAARYPAYCEGFGYAVRASRLPDLYLCSLFSKFFWIDDVYVTGVLAAAAKVPLAGFWAGHGYTGQLPSLASEKILDYIFLVADHNEFLEVVWHRLWRSVLQFSLDLTL
ncbi:hypothetical protein BOX15_Mlig027891g3 [Macrostomum lignano]|uniref:Hexosyltransferase n=1 Tax=Macrostomum lignano TaxID=282301 RepID=A0A267FYC5_9PLAT|nr:hypothetical protein BOX15_Mlig027891g3 [Macrostomum lignano]